MSADKALVVVTLAASVTISNTPQVQGYLKYAIAKVYHHFQPLMPKFTLPLMETLYIMGNHGGLFI